jgi:membrane protein
MKLDLRSHPLVQRAADSVVGRLVAALLEIRLYERALTLAGQAFIALVPLLIVLATMLGSADSEAVGNWLIQRFELTGPSAEAVQSLFSRPPSTSSSLTIIGLVTVLISASSFARSVQRTYEVAWDLPARGFRRNLNGIEGAIVLIGLLGVLAWVSSLRPDVVGGRALTIVIQLCVAVPAWLLLARLLLSGRVAWHLLLPGAVVSAVGQVLTNWGGSIYVPLLIERNIERYGVIGVAIALISWLIVLAFLIVAMAVVGAQLGAALATYERTRSAASAEALDGAERERQATTAVDQPTATDGRGSGPPA